MMVIIADKLKKNKKKRKTIESSETKEQKKNDNNMILNIFMDPNRFLISIFNFYFCTALKFNYC